MGLDQTGPDWLLDWAKAGVKYLNDLPTDHEEIIFPEAQGVTPHIDTKQAKEVFFGNRAAQYKIKPIHTTLQGGEKNKNVKQYVTQRLTASQQFSEATALRYSYPRTKKEKRNLEISRLAH